MAFIKTQKIVRSEDGTIISGSAAIVDSVYVNTGRKDHSKQEVREKLGKVLFLSKDKKSGIFLSPTRGLIEYDSRSDSFENVSVDDPRIICHNLVPETEIHTVFGDAFLLLSLLEKYGLIQVFKAVFPKDEEFERVLAHVLHGVLKDGSRISCDNFLRKSFASYITSEVPLSTLHSDTSFFTIMGADHVKVAFFKAFIAFMQKQDPAFGERMLCGFYTASE